VGRVVTVGGGGVRTSVFDVGKSRLIFLQACSTNSLDGGSVIIRSSTIGRFLEGRDEDGNL